MARDERVLAESRATSPRCIAAIAVFEPAKIGWLRRRPHSRGSRETAQTAPAQNGDAGGLNHGKAMWGAIVDRNGRLCALSVSTDDKAATWPGSRAIAIAKASTSNAFSSDVAPMSTARLYTLSQPGHSLWGAANGNPLNPLCAWARRTTSRRVSGSVRRDDRLWRRPGALQGQTRVGGLGVSGDTACADHEIAKRVRRGRWPRA